MKKTMSLEQVEANRANARRSTGPRTAVGKANSKMNAVKYGILAREVVLRGEAGSEREQEFQSLYRQFWVHLAPVGPMETMLVERMVTTYWRLHRVLIGERGEIAHSVGDSGRRMSGLELDEVGSSRRDITHAMEVLGRVRQRVREEGELTEAILEEVMRAFNDVSNPVATRLKGIWEDALRNPENLSVEESVAGGFKSPQQERLLTYIDRELTCFEWKLTELREREEHEAESRRDAAFLPSPTVLDKILRYEASLERQLYRAMNQLERLQRSRKGEVVPPPLTMEVSGG